MIIFAYVTPVFLLECEYEIIIMGSNIIMCLEMGTND